ncbi:hypothetical protein BH11PSE10_BH11PSE10_06310 [soil metagenome]
MIILSLAHVVNTLLVTALASGLVMVGYRFGSERESPTWLAKLHGFAAVAALAVLMFSWNQATPSRAAVMGVACLLSAAALGLVLNLGYHWRHQPLPEGLVFTHMAIAFLGFLIVLLSMMSGAVPA